MLDVPDAACAGCWMLDVSGAGCWMLGVLDAETCRIHTPEST